MDGVLVHALQVAQSNLQDLARPHFHLFPFETLETNDRSGLILSGPTEIGACLFRFMGQERDVLQNEPASGHGPLETAVDPLHDGEMNGKYLGR